MFLTAIMLYRHLANLSRGFKLIREKEKKKKEKAQILALIQIAITSVTFRKSFNPSGS